MNGPIPKTFSHTNFQNFDNQGQCKKEKCKKERMLTLYGREHSEETHIRILRFNCK
jgi:hypothetical protein